MNYNPNTGLRNPQGPGRKIKHVSDVNAMGPAAPMPTAAPYMPSSSVPPVFDTPMSGGGGGGGFNMYGGPAMQTNNIGGFGSAGSHMPAQAQHQPLQQQQQPNYAYTAAPQPNTQPMYGGGPQTAFVGLPAGSGVPVDGNATAQFANAIPQFAMFQQPIVQDMAMQYGQRLADQGKQLVENQFEKWVPVAKMKYYFAVDNAYVARKMRLLFFPFVHKDWSLKYDQEHPVQPRYDINAPDLYIPTMGYITYVVVAGLLLGMQKRFSPEQLGIQASSALAYSIFELVIYSITLYVMNIKTSLKTLDLLAFTGYKYINIVLCLLTSLTFYGRGYYLMLTYSSLSLGFFLLRTLRTKVLQDTTPAAPSGAINYDPYGSPQQLDYTGGRKRKLYFLFLVVGGQALFSFLLSKHLYLSSPANLDASEFKL